MKRLLVILLFISLSLISFAQRQTQGHLSAEIYGGYGPPVRTYSLGSSTSVQKKSAPSVNGGAAVSIYDYSGRVVVGIDYLSLPRGYQEAAIYNKYDELISPEFCFFYKSQTYSLFAGYMYRLWSTRSRNVILSCGGYLDIGVCVCNQLLHHTSSKTNTSENIAGFYLGVTPDIQLEFFPLASASLYVSIKSKIKILNFLPGYSNWFHPVGCLGAKYYF